VTIDNTTPAADPATIAPVAAEPVAAPVADVASIADPAQPDVPSEPVSIPGYDCDPQQPAPPAAE